MYESIIKDQRKENKNIQVGRKKAGKLQEVKRKEANTERGKEARKE
jgi:hypothetical protein